jgi:hypothetical protein
MLGSDSTMIKLWHHWLEGGWMMYPVFALGLITVGSGGRFALRGEHQLLPFISWMLRTLLATGAFGYAAELMRVFNASQIADPWLSAHIVMEGFTEATHVPALALMFVAFTCLTVAVGQRRFPLPNPSAVAR